MMSGLNSAFLYLSFLWISLFVIIVNFFIWLYCDFFIFLWTFLFVFISLCAQLGEPKTPHFTYFPIFYVHEGITFVCQIPQNQPKQTKPFFQSSLSLHNQGSFTILAMFSLIFWVHFAPAAANPGKAWEDICEVSSLSSKSYMVRTCQQSTSDSQLVSRFELLALNTQHSTCKQVRFWQSRPR